MIASGKKVTLQDMHDLMHDNHDVYGEKFAPQMIALVRAEMHQYTTEE